MPLKWIPLTERQPGPRGPRILVTNNLPARDAHGHMSHVWMVDRVHEPRSGQFTAFADAGETLSALTHWADPFV